MIGFHKKNSKGFTIVEMLITAVIFSVIFGAAMNVFTDAIKIQKYNLSQQQLLDQSSYAIEYMARALRMAKKGGSIACTGGESYRIDNLGINPNSRIYFVNYDGQCQYFEWYSGYHNIKVGGGSFGSSVVFLTSTKYFINKLYFSKYGDQAGDNLQPRVAIFIDMEDNSLPQNRPRIKLQTEVSLRNLDD